MTPLPTEIRVEDAGATERTIELTGNWRRDLTTALNHEHGDCEDESCDIREALEQDYVLVAASLLSGATEVPVLDAVRHAYEDADAIPEGEGYADMAATPDWEGWTNHFDEFARKCESCGSFTWAHSNYEPTQCANCRAELTQPLSGEFVLSIELDNDALSEPRDIAEMLRKCAYQLENITGTDLSGSLVDANGNTVGKFEVER